MAIATTSQRIRILRPLLILLVITAHTPGTLYRPDKLDLALDLEHFIHVLLSGVLAVTAMPTLSVISGYLAVYSLKRRAYFPFIRRKALTLLVPMVLWGLPMAAFIYFKQSNGIPFRASLDLYPFDITGWFIALSAVAPYPANPPLYFLRELFLACTLLPIFLIVGRYRTGSLILAAVLLVCSLNEITFGVVIRMEIYLFFFLGVMVACHSSPEKLSTVLYRYRYILYSSFGAGCLALSFYALTTQGEYFWPIMKMVTLLGPAVFWELSRPLSHTYASRILLFLSPAAFTLFLGHVVVLIFMWEAWIFMFHKTAYNYHYVAFWFASMLVTVGTLWLAWKGYESGKRHITARHLALKAN